MGATLFNVYGVFDTYFQYDFVTSTTVKNYGNVC